MTTDIQTNLISMKYLTNITKLQWLIWFDLIYKFKTMKRTIDELCVNENDAFRTTFVTITEDVQLWVNMKQSPYCACLGPHVHGRNFIAIAQ